MDISVGVFVMCLGGAASLAGIVSFVATRKSDIKKYGYEKGHNEATVKSDIATIKEAISAIGTQIKEYNIAALIETVKTNSRDIERIEKTMEGRDRDLGESIRRIHIRLDALFKVQGIST
jgi:hypothetical protein